MTIEQGNVGIYNSSNDTLLLYNKPPAFLFNKEELYCPQFNSRAK